MEIIRKIRNTLENNFLVRQIVLAFSLITLVLVLAYFSLSFFTRHGEKYSIPDFSMMTVQDAQKIASKHQFRLEIIDSVFVAGKPKGVIIEQYPKRGSVVKSKRRIFLTTTTHAPKRVPIPYVTGFSLRQAKNKIVGAGLEIDALVYRQDIATNNVLEQRYKGRTITNSNELGDIGSGVQLIVGYNPVDDEPIVPDLIGLTFQQAKSKLWESGFNVGVVEHDAGVTDDNMANTKVYSQSVGKNRSAMYGRSISMGLTTDQEKIRSAARKSDADAIRYQEEREKAEADSLAGADDLTEEAL